MIDHVLRCVLPAAYDILPPAMESPAASAMILAIGLQESNFVSRRQKRGPARSFWQFEHSGVMDVLVGPSSHAPISAALAALCYDPMLPPDSIVAILEHNDTLAAAFARCMLYRSSTPLPTADQATAGWDLYSSRWHPGTPRPETWAAFYSLAWSKVDAQERTV